MTTYNQLTTEDFIKKAVEVHGNKYDYSKTKYKLSKLKVTITCRVHGDFKQVANSHLQGSGCRKCGNKQLSKQKTLSKDQFVEKATKIHGDKYDYTNVIYKRAKLKVEIICPIHGSFWQTPDGHTRNNASGCPKCGDLRMAKKNTSTTDNFINRAKKIHKHKYTYKKTRYVKDNIPTIITCPIHGDFKQRPQNHLQGGGCIKCGIESTTVKLRKTNATFIKEAKKIHGNKYNYSKTKYNGAHRKVIIICAIHGEFQRSPHNHLQGQGCNRCARVIDTKGFIERATKKHGNKYDYSKSVYVGNKDKITIICPNHGKFQQIASAHLNGSGCPICKSSKAEIFIFNWLRNKKFKFVTEKTFSDCKNKNVLPFDFEVETKNGKVLIEYNGEQHYRAVKFFGGEKRFKHRQKCDKIKKDWAKKNNIPLLIIPYNRDIEKSLEKFFDL